MKWWRACFFSLSCFFLLLPPASSSSFSSSYLLQRLRDRIFHRRHDDLRYPPLNAKSPFAHHRQCALSNSIPQQPKKRAMSTKCSLCFLRWAVQKFIERVRRISRESIPCNENTYLFHKRIEFGRFVSNHMSAISRTVDQRTRSVDR